jgi:hypothetical protein
VKTLCFVNKSSSHFEAERNCEYEGMKLANASEYLPQLASFAATVQPTGGRMWVGSKAGLKCQQLLNVADSGSLPGYNVSSYYCYPNRNSICEFNSK